MARRWSRARALVSHQLSRPRSEGAPPPSRPLMSRPLMSRPRNRVPSLRRAASSRRPSRAADEPAAEPPAEPTAEPARPAYWHASRAAGMPTAEPAGEPRRWRTGEAGARAGRPARAQSRPIGDPRLSLPPTSPRAGRSREPGGREPLLSHRCIRRRAEPSVLLLSG